MPLDQDLDLFFGQSSDAATQVYARAARHTHVNAKLAGKISGPYCDSSRTLPMSVPFRDLGSGSTLLARAVVPDLCPWLPELPNLYRVQVEVVADGQAIDQAEREWGAHRFAIRDTDLVWNATRVVLRGVQRRYARQMLDDWKLEVAPVMMVTDPDESLCREASHSGVPIVAITTDSEELLTHRLRQLSRWPAVLMAIVQGQLASDFFPHEAVPNLILATSLATSGDTPSWAQVLFCSEDLLRRGLAPQAGRRPIIATRCLDDFQDVQTARRACDELQADLAGIGQFAGYFVL